MRSTSLVADSPPSNQYHRIFHRYLVAMVLFGRQNGLYPHNRWFVVKWVLCFLPLTCGRKWYGVMIRRNVLPAKRVSKHAAEAQDTIAGSEVLAVPSSHSFSSFVIDSDEQLPS